MLQHVLEGRFVRRGNALRQVDAEVDDEHAPRAARDVHPVYPRDHDVSVRTAVHVRRLPEHPSRCIAGNVKRTTLRVAHERHACVLCESTSLGEVHAAGQVAVDCLDRLAVQHALRLRTVVLSDYRDPDGGAFDHPRLVRPRHEDIAALPDPIQC